MGFKGFFMIYNFKVIVSNYRGFCSGVERAIKISNNILKNFGKPIYVYNEIVHNKFIVNSFKKKGFIFVNNLNQVPKNSFLIISAHGVSKIINTISRKKNIKVFDSTCPLVKKIHYEVKKMKMLGYNIFL